MNSGSNSDLCTYIIPMFPTVIKPGEIRKFVQANGTFHVVVVDLFRDRGSQNSRQNLTPIKLKNITSSVNICAWVTSDRFTSAMVAV